MRQDYISTNFIYQLLVHKLLILEYNFPLEVARFDAISFILSIAYACPLVSG
jgi:hypothetical protein